MTLGAKNYFLWQTKSMKQKTYHFIIYGIIGWLVEVMFTGLGSLIRGDIKLTSWTYLWMFPIYGMAVLLEPIHDKIRHVPWWIKGIVWVGFIYIIEYFSGFALKIALGVCPWNYTSKSYFNIEGLIRLDYAPFWFIAGLIFEKLHDFLKVYI